MKTLSNYSVSGEPSLILPKSNSIPVYILGRVLLVKSCEITHLEGEGNYTFVCTLTGKRHLVSKNLKTVEELLGANFVPVHKSYMINPKHIRARLSDNIQLSCGKHIMV